MPESTHLNFYDENLSVIIQKNTCLVQLPEQTERLSGHTAITIGNTLLYGFRSIYFIKITRLKNSMAIWMLTMTSTP